MMPSGLHDALSLSFFNTFHAMCTTDGTRWHVYQMHSKHIFYNKFKTEK